MRWIVLLMVLLGCVQSRPTGILINSGLDLQGGIEQLVMQPGEKLYLKATHSVWRFPVVKGLEYSSKYPQIACVDQHGLVRALLPGRTVISVWNAAGDNGTIEIIVTENRKLSLGAWALLGALCVVTAVIFVKKYFRVF